MQRPMRKEIHHPQITLLLLVLVSSSHLFAYGSTNATKNPARSNRLLAHSYEASIRFINRHYCAGAIIGPHHVLTAAHCFHRNGKKYSKSMLKYASVVVGSNGSLDDEGGQTYKIKNVTTHRDLLEESSDFWISDIAVVTLESGMAYSKLVQPIDMARANASEATSSRTSIWDSPVESLQSIEVYLLTHERCLYQLKEKYLGQYDSKICGYTTSRRNLCLKFDGSPLVQNDRVVGVASESDGCKNGRPDVYTNVYRSLHIVRRAIALDYNETMMALHYPQLEGDATSANFPGDRSVVQMSH